MAQFAGEVRCRHILKDEEEGEREREREREHERERVGREGRRERERERGREREGGRERGRERERWGREIINTHWSNILSALLTKLTCSNISAQEAGVHLIELGEQLFLGLQSLLESP